MLNDTIAAILQILSLPFEVLGLALALIEIRFQGVAQFMRNRIIGLGSDIRGNIFKDYVRGLNRRIKDSPGSTVGIALLLLACLVPSLMLAIRSDGSGGLMMLLGFALLILSVATFAAFGLRFILRALLSFVGSFAPGKEIGTLGLLLALIGLLSESYQVADTAVNFPASKLTQFEGAITAGIIVVSSLILMAGFFSLAISLIIYRFPRMERYFKANN